MSPENIQYQEREVTVDKVKTFIYNNLPNFAKVIENEAALDKFQQESEKDINKVILFSKKSKVPTIFKALTGYFKDRVRFAFIASDKKDLIQKYNV